MADAWYGDSREHEKGETIGMAKAGFTGISLGSAHTVPRMLFPIEISGLSFGDMTDMKYEDKATVKGVECDVVFSKKWGTRAWIDSKTHLLRRVFEKSDFEGYTFSDTTDYDPRVNIDIKDELMVFDPPHEESVDADASVVRSGSDSTEALLRALHRLEPR